tara:strand:- start:1045 stop:1308 length:264 start_codon:yes stop_codon:yes gene_type:complete
VNEDWFDDLVNGEPTPITFSQLVTIESKIDYCNLPISYKTKILNNLNNYTEIEAELVIKDILDNQIPIDPKDQYKQMRKNGMFDYDE